jgi:hypothetical protein
MKTMITKLIASVLFVSFLVLPADLSAKEKRGANLIVTRLDGSQLSGELIAVKRDSLLLLSNGRDESIDLADIKIVRMIKKSRSGKGALYGFAAGAGSGAILGLILDMPLEDDYPLALIVASGAFLGAIGALSGLLVGSMAGVDSSFTVAGKPETVVNEYWDKLRTHARVPRLPGRSSSSR